MILVGHSYGGMVITGAADRAADRIGRVVYLDAANPDERAVAPRRRRSDHRGDPPVGRGRRRCGAGAAPVARRRPVLRRDRSRRRGLDGRPPDRPPVEVLRATAAARPNEAACRGAPDSTTSSARRRWPLATPSSWRRRAASGRLWEIDTGHDLMITEPAAVADALLEIAAIVMSVPPRASASHRPPGSRRSRAVRAQRLSARGVDAPAGRGAGGLLRAARLPAVLGDHQARRHHRHHRAAGALLERARADPRAGSARPRSPSEMVVTLDPPRHGPLRRVGDAPLHAPRASGRGTRRSTASRPRSSTTWRSPTAPRSSTSSSASPRRSRSR